MSDEIVVKGTREHPGTKILMLRNLVADYSASGFGTGQATLGDVNE